MIANEIIAFKIVKNNCVIKKHLSCLSYMNYSSGYKNKIGKIKEENISLWNYLYKWKESSFYSPQGKNW